MLEDTAPAQEIRLRVDPEAIAAVGRNTALSSSKTEKKTTFKSIECASFVTVQHLSIGTPYISVLEIPSPNIFADEEHHRPVNSAPTMQTSMHERDPRRILSTDDSPALPTFILSAIVCDLSSTSYQGFAENSFHAELTACRRATISPPPSHRRPVERGTAHGGRCSTSGSEVGESWHRAMEEGVRTLAAAQIISGRGEDLPAPPRRLALAAAAAAVAAEAALYTY